LDAKLRASMRTELKKLHQRLDATFVYVTHDQTEAMTMGDRIVTMKDGVVQQIDTPQNLYNFPRNVFVAGFIGSPQMNFMDCLLCRDEDGLYLTAGENKLYLPGEKASDKMEPYLNKTVKLGIRPENIYDSAQSLAENSGALVEASLDVAEPMGSEVYLYLDFAGFRLTARVASPKIYRPGERVKITMDMRKIHLFDCERGDVIVSFTA
jgi:multiple sugar transport system ATP-binding protein